MKPKERVIRAIRRQEVDRTPLDCDSSFSVIDRLQRDFECSSWEDVLRLLHVDIRGIGPGEYTGPQRVHEDGRLLNWWGIESDGSTYADGIGYRPFSDVKTVDEVYAYDWPDPDDFDYSQIDSYCDTYSGYAIKGSAWCPIFCMSCDLCGMETMMYYMAAEPEIAGAILECVTNVYLGMNKRVFEAANGKLDICYMGDDFGHQHGLLMSPTMFREMIKPHFARLYKQAKEYGLITMHHSCGAIFEIIPDLIEIGVDVLDPVQVNAAGMDPLLLKRSFGDVLSFHGAIDTQTTLPFGTPEDVRAEVRSRIAILGEGGGYILGGSQAFIDDIPTANIHAMYDEAIQPLNEMSLSLSF